MKKGFTLVELLAVIVILAIIALITVPLIINIVESSRKGAARSSAYGYMEGVNIFYSKELLKGSNFTLNGTLNVDENGYLEDNKIEVEGTMAKGGHLTYNNGKVSEGCLTINEYKVSIENDEVTNVEKGSCDGTSTESEEEEVLAPCLNFDFDSATGTITGASCIDGSGSSLIIPSKIDGIDVIAIADNAFPYIKLYQTICPDDCYPDYSGESYDIGYIVIPKTVVSIGESAFVGIVSRYNISNSRIIVNKTGRAFNWCSVIDGVDDTDANCTFVTGKYGEIEITDVDNRTNY